MGFTSDTIAAALDVAATEIKGARNLRELLDGLRAFAAACENNAGAIERRFAVLDEQNEMLARGLALSH